MLDWLYGQGMPRHRLKPAHEPICLMMKPMELSSKAKQMAATGTGRPYYEHCPVEVFGEKDRFPPNVLLSHLPECEPGACRPGCVVDCWEDKAKFYPCFRYC